MIQGREGEGEEGIKESRGRGKMGIRNRVRAEGGVSGRKREGVRVRGDREKGKKEAGGETEEKG